MKRARSSTSIPKIDESLPSSTKPSRQYWLLKTEPDELGWSHMEKAGDKTARYDGVRGPGPRNSMKTMRAGDLAFLYHSGVSTPHIAGVVKVNAEAFPDPTQFDPKSKYYDATATKVRGFFLEQPKWFAIDLLKVKKFPSIVTLATLKANGGDGGALSSLKMLKQARLSVSTVTEDEWNFILSLAKVKLDD